MSYQIEWTNSLLREFIQFSNGKPLESQIDTNGDVNLITLDSVDISGKLKYIHKRVKQTNGSLLPGDIVSVLSTVVADLNQGNLLGMSAIIPSDGTQYVLNQRMGRIRIVNESLRSDFLRLCLNASRKHFAERAQGTSQKHIYARDFFSLPILTPPLEEQKAIAEVLSDVDELIAQTERLIAKKRSIKEGVMQELLKPKEGWVKLKIGDIAKVGRGRVISHKEISKAVDRKYPVYSSQTSVNGVMGYIDTYDFDGEYVTWTTDGEKAGTVFFRTGKFNCTNVCGTLKVEHHNSHFVALALALKTPPHVSRNLANPKLMNGPMKKIEIELPSIEVQNQIVGINRVVEEELQILDQKIEKIKMIKVGIMNQLLTGKTRLV